MRCRPYIGAGGLWQKRLCTKRSRAACWSDSIELDSNVRQTLVVFIRGHCSRLTTWETLQYIPHIFSLTGSSQAIEGWIRLRTAIPKKCAMFGRFYQFLMHWHNVSRCWLIWTRRWHVPSWITSISTNFSILGCVRCPSFLHHTKTMGPSRPVPLLHGPVWPGHVMSSAPWRRRPKCTTQWPSKFRGYKGSRVEHNHATISTMQIRLHSVRISIKVQNLLPAFLWK